MSDHIDDPAAIERDLHATRARLDSRLHELSERLSPGQMVDEALHYMRSSQGADFTRNLTQSVRDRPLPVVLAGIGLAWLMIAGPRPRERVVYRKPYPSGLGNDGGDIRYRAWQSGKAVVRNPDESETDFRGRVIEARGKVLGVTRQAQDTAQSFADRVEEALFAARDSVSDSVQQAADWAGETAQGVRDSAADIGDRLSRRTNQLGDKASDSMRRASDWAGDTAQGWRDTAADIGNRLSRRTNQLGDAANDSYARVRQAAGRSTDVLATIAANPVLVGSLGVLTGAVLGTLLPPTELERQYLGETVEGAREAVQQTAQELADRGMQAAHGAMNVAVDAGRQAAGEIDRNVREATGAKTSRA
ncbi:MAG TPA: DUF3618 domain-containing protein [Acetobacteraceae bacterium]|nr:DUF3618 domain-containing protein [Acetobacteraceae bacterium]